MEIEFDTRKFDHRWYAVYTRSRHEKRVHDRLKAMSLESFLPLCNTLSRWKDRNSYVQFPLFPGYLFVRIGLHDRLHVLQAPGVVNLVGQEHKPEPLPDRDIETLRTAVSQNIPLEPHSFLKTGEKVLIANGPFQGVEGILLRKNKLRVLLSLSQIQSSFVLDIDAQDVYPVNSAPFRFAVSPNLTLKADPFRFANFAANS